jgi:drug/metabolite transporter (DMT)-like permease
LKIKYHLLALSAILFWGISLVATKTILLNGFTPNFITFVRFAIASTLLEISHPRTKEKIAKKDLKFFLMMALGGITFFYYFETAGLQFTTVANTSLITATIPLFTLLTAMLFFKKKLTWQNYAGIILGLLGTSLLFYKDLLHPSLHLKGDFLVFCSVIMWIIYSFAYRKIMDKYSTSFVTRKIFLYGFVSLSPLFFWEWKQNANAVWNANVVISFIFLSVICSYLAYYFWNLSLKNIGVKVTSNFILFLPIVSIVAGIIVFSELFTLSLIWSTILILSGAYLSSVSQKEHTF